MSRSCLSYVCTWSQAFIFIAGRCDVAVAQWDIYDFFIQVQIADAAASV